MRQLRNNTLLLLVLLFPELCECQSRNDSIRLMNDSLDGYNRKHRPVVNYSNPVQVNITFEVVSLQDFDEVNGVISLVLVMNTIWRDEVIGWDPASYGGITSQIYDVEDVWYPILVTASSSEEFEDLAKEWMTLRIYSTGLVYFRPGIFVKSSCGVDVTYYPFDVQTCDLMFIPWADTPEEVKLIAPVPYTQRTFYTEHGEWKIKRNSTYVNSLNVLFVHIELERKPLFAIVNTVLPIILMSALNILVFVLPAESGERVSYSITVLLAIAVFLTLVADSLPKTSQPMSLLAYFLMINLIISCSICVATILNLRIFHNKDDKNIPLWQQRMARNVTCIAHCSKTGSGINKHKRNSDRKGHNSCSERYTGIDDVGEVMDEQITPKFDEQNVRWQDVACAYDKLLIITFCLASTINTIAFYVIISFR